jgi:hypothetical protein
MTPASFEDIGQDDRADRDKKPGGPHDPEPWSEPIPLGETPYVPTFPSGELPPDLADWVEAVARGTQTPPDLAGLLVLSVCGAALAKKFRFLIREGWSEPANLFTVSAMLPGERKSAVFEQALAPVEEYEQELRDAAAPLIAEAESEHRALEARLKALEAKAAKPDDPNERQKLQAEAKEAARELARHVVPAEPQLLADDATPEHLVQILARQGGRALQASDEGTAFEIAKGRYSEAANFECYLKGHSGGSLRVGRVHREGDRVSQAALSLALCVQPDVISGLAEQATMRGRGFLARFLYALPQSLVGARQVCPRPVPEAVSARYRELVRLLWQQEGDVDEQGRAVPHLLAFSPEADQEMQRFERWLEPRLAEGSELAHLAGWASKLAGACARIAGILHVARALSTAGERWGRPVSAETAAAAIRIGRDYFVPHAIAAFQLMGADPRLADARRAARWLTTRFCESVISMKGGPSFQHEGIPVSRRELHVGVWGGSRTADQVEAVVELLVKHGYLRPQEVARRTGRGRPPSQLYLFNPLACPAAEKDGTFSQKSQKPRNNHEGNGRPGEGMQS